MDLSSLHYTKSHEWVHLEGDIGTIGITDFAVAELTDLVYVELPEADTTVSAGESCGEIESVKAVSELVSPVDGIVVEKNDSLENELEKMSTSPFDQGWLIRVKLTDPSQLDGLMDQAAYKQYCENTDH